MILKTYRLLVSVVIPGAILCINACVKNHLTGPDHFKFASFAVGDTWIYSCIDMEPLSSGLIKKYLRTFAIIDKNETDSGVVFTASISDSGSAIKDCFTIGKSCDSGTIIPVNNLITQRFIAVNDIVKLCVPYDYKSIWHPWGNSAGGTHRETNVCHMYSYRPVRYGGPTCGLQSTLRFDYVENIGLSSFHDSYWYNYGANVGTVEGGNDIHLLSFNGIPIETPDDF